ncbi:MAG: dihydrodipicolinate synthase family protein [Desulfobacterales bacterium]|nr:MAG: dihydrodipicolinate synthase family protein [Desulfobacterales bacterium]
MFKLKGVVPPMITPFDREGDLDLDNLEKLLDFLKDRVDGLFICGSYGCGPMMSLEERKTVAETCVRVVDGKIPIITHTGTTSTRQTVELSRHAEKIGCAGVSAVGPYYYHHGADHILAFYAAMIESVSAAFPVYVYHNPSFSGYEIALDTVKKLRDLGIHGVKDATFNIMTFATYMRELAASGFDVVLGTEAMWAAACALGAEGYIPGLGNAFPEICRQMYLEGIQNKIQQCRQTQFRVNQLRDVMYLARSTQLAVYAMLEIRNVIKAYPRAPFIPATAKEKDKMRRALESLEVI